MTHSKQPSLVGVIHLPALPGAPLSKGSARDATERAIDLAVREAAMLESAGFEGVIVENFGDTPFFKDQVPPLTVAAMSNVVRAVRETTKLALGVNVLRNDAFSALAIAAATGAEFIRVNVLSGVAATDQGIIEGKAAELMRARAALAAQGTRVSVWGDALVKHARTLSVDELEPALEEVALRANADAVILTGSTTGRTADLSRVKRAKELGLKTPLYLGSGGTPENIENYAPWIDGVIVGSALRAGGRAGAPLERKRLTAFSRAWSRCRE